MEITFKMKIYIHWWSNVLVCKKFLVNLYVYEEVPQSDTYTFY